jgi:hypothetical protein
MTHGTVAAGIRLNEWSPIRAEGMPMAEETPEEMTSGIKEHAGRECIREYACAECGKRIAFVGQYTYRRLIKGKRMTYCSYSCWRRPEVKWAKKK